MATIEDIKTRSLQIKNETIEGANAADRVGGVLVDLTDDVSKKAYISQNMGTSTTAAPSENAVGSALSLKSSKNVLIDLHADPDYADRNKTIQSMFVDAVLHGADQTIYNYSITKIFINEATSGYGIVLGRKNKTTSTKENFGLSTKGLFINKTSSNNVTELNKLANGRAEKLDLDFSAWGCRLEITIDTSFAQATSYDLGYDYPQSYADTRFSSEVYSLKKNISLFTGTQNTTQPIQVQRLYEYFKEITIYAADTDNYDYRISGLYKNNTAQGNGIVLSRINKTDGTIENYGLATAGTYVDLTIPTNRTELNKLTDSGIQKINLYYNTWNVFLSLVVDTDAILGTYTDFGQTEKGWDDYKLAKQVYSVHPVTMHPLAANSLKAYPFAGYPTTLTNKSASALSDRHKRIFLDAKITGGDVLKYDYYVCALYKNHTTQGNGVTISRRDKTTLKIETVSYTNSYGTGANNTDYDSRVTINRMSLGGIQTINISDRIWDMSFMLVMNTDQIVSASHDFCLTTPSNMPNLKFDDSVFIKTVKNAIPYFDTLRDALYKQTDRLFQVGNVLITDRTQTKLPKTMDVFATQFIPNVFQEKYTRVGGNGYANPNRNSVIIKVKAENGDFMDVKHFSKRYIYFGSNSKIYRTSEELKYPFTTHQNTVYDEFVLPAVVPDTANGIDAHTSLMHVYETPDGELLIEITNGQTGKDGAGKDGIRPQLYKTSGLKNITPTLENGIYKYDLTGHISRVLVYKAGTHTDGSCGTSVSMHANKIAIAPYGFSVTGLVFYSTDYGSTWKTIFNMGVTDWYTDTKGANGAWPLPENLNPAMPSDMWTVGGTNPNRHVHGVTIDPYFNRIWVFTGDAFPRVDGASATWYSDDEGVTWVRLQTMDPTDKYIGGEVGLQAMGAIATKDYVLIGSDSPSDGFYRYTRGRKENRPVIESAYFCKGEYSASLKRVFGGAVETPQGHIYALFHPHAPEFHVKGVVVFTTDGIHFDEVYFDETNLKEDGTDDYIISWVSFIGRDRFGNIYIHGRGNRVIKLY